MSLEGWNFFQRKTTDGQMSNGPCCVCHLSAGTSHKPAPFPLLVLVLLLRLQMSIKIIHPAKYRHAQ